MRRINRPLEDPDFANAVTDTKNEIAKVIGSGKKPQFPSLWSDFKTVFSVAQHRKCGFCEGPVSGLQYGDVEHFQPKAEVHELAPNPADWGREASAGSSVEHRKTSAVPGTSGYWWRAYEWDNYLLSCQICNQQWKKNLFPVQGIRATTPSCPPEQHRLLSPFANFDPAEHFSYGWIGEINGLTPEGHATIVTCGLDRPSLRLLRYKTAKATHEHLDEIAGDVTERDVLRVLRCVERDGQDVEPFCGMVQTIFRQRTGLDWASLSTLISTLQESRTPGRPLCDC